MELNQFTTSTTNNSSSSSSSSNSSSSNSNYNITTTSTTNSSNNNSLEFNNYNNSILNQIQIPIKLNNIKQQKQEKQKQQTHRKIEDFKLKHCWICLEDEELNLNKVNTFIHACDCTLIAHEICLLEWINTQNNNNKPPHCPVCNSIYKIKQKNPLILNLYKSMLKIYDKFGILITTISITTSIWLTSTTYTILVIRTCLGSIPTQQLLFNSPWPLSYYYRLPILPFLLILSRTHLVDGILPFLTLIVVIPLPPTQTNKIGLDLLKLSYPPSLGLTLCLLPWFRLGYLSIKKVVYKYFGRKLGSGLNNATGGMTNILNPDETGEDEDDFIVEAEVVEEQQQQPEGGPNQIGVEAGGIRQRISLGRFNSILISTLASPFIAAVGGMTLMWLAKKEWKGVVMFRKVLGVSTLLASTRNLQINPSNSNNSKNSITKVGLNVFPNLSTTFSSLSPFTSFLKSISLPRSTSTTSLVVPDMVDPIWIRNTLALGIILIIRDGLDLLMGYLEERRKESRKVIGRDFSDGLEL